MKSFDAPASQLQIEEALVIRIAKLVHREVTITNEEDFEIINGNAAKHFKRWLVSVLEKHTSKMDMLTGGEFDLTAFDQGL